MASDHTDRGWAVNPLFGTVAGRKTSNAT